MLKVTLLTHTQLPEKIVAASAKLCYSPSEIDTILDGLTEEKTASFVDMLSQIGHESPIEHASFTFGIEGVSRSLLAQITRHRMASFSVQSQRYVKENKFEFVLPPEIEKIPEAKEEFLKAMQEDVDHYDKLTNILMSKHIADMQSNGENVDEKKAEKMAIEDARFVLPNACTTKMICTMNARSLKNFFAIRCCNRAQWEIRDLAQKMFIEVVKVAPSLFSKCGPSCFATGKCPEGKMSCGKITQVQQNYKNIVLQYAGKKDE